MPRAKTTQTKTPSMSDSEAGTAAASPASEILPLPSMNHTTRPEDYTCFYTTKHVNGWASQWYPATFTSTISIATGDDSPENIYVTFPTTEHWMMLHKALLFHDFPSARQIIALCSSTQSQTTKTALLYVKRLGRRVSNFSETTWNNHRTKIVVEGNLLKYQQNAELRDKLLATGDTIIVEAAPRDKIWGIGRGESTAMQAVKAGKGGEGWGLNLLGRALMEVRRRLSEAETENVPK